MRGFSILGNKGIERFHHSLDYEFDEPINPITFGKYNAPYLPLFTSSRYFDTQSQRSLEEVMSKMKELYSKEKEAALEDLKSKYEDPEYPDLFRLHHKYSDLYEKYQKCMALFNRFDDNVLFRILKYVSPSDLNICALVCVKFYSILKKFYWMLNPPSPLFFEECKRYNCEPCFSLRKFFHIEKPNALLSALLLTQRYKPKDERVVSMENTFPLLLKVAESYLQSLSERRIKLRLSNSDLCIFVSDVVKHKFKIFENLDPIEVDLFFATTFTEHKQLGVQIIEPEIDSIVNSPRPIYFVINIPIKCEHKTYVFKYSSLSGLF